MTCILQTRGERYYYIFAGKIYWLNEKSIYMYGKYIIKCIVEKKKYNVNTAVKEKVLLKMAEPLI